ncbi:hypothetical protein B9Z55_023991 [Caenorhabditis nigoni]|uniref:Uncharacterized protein n=1 Tax=Caenorhabditis nigoni TaxID=1611254 RepID=A0A2G5SSN2_9PELO|nr:hypothetical protein B9Z55_023991 [Caenorhabditis nigoni]
MRPISIPFPLTHAYEGHDLVSMIHSKLSKNFKIYTVKRLSIANFEYVIVCSFRLKNEKLLLSPSDNAN